MSVRDILQAAAGASGGASDPNFNQVTLLLTGDGTNGAQNNTFLDSSSNNFTVNTPTGFVMQGTFSPFSVPNGYWSVYNNWTPTGGGGGYLEFADNVALRPQTSAFTIEFWTWWNPTDATTSPPIITRTNTSGFPRVGYEIFLLGNNLYVSFDNANGPFIDTGTPLPKFQWAHVALVREGTGTNQTKLYLNGTVIGTATLTTDINNSVPLRIGTNFQGATYFPGYISNFRFVKGTAVYTGNFTPPTAPLTAITNTQLLTCQSNYFVDKSPNNLSFTLVNVANLNFAIQPFSPFAPTAAYAPTTNGGSGYFYGGNAALSIAGTTQLALGNSNFTLECWVYVATQVTTTIFGRWRTGRQEYLLYTDVGTPIFAFRPNSAGAFITSSTKLQVGAWNHLAVTRSGSSFNMYLNGVNVGSGTNSGTASNEGDPFDIGGYGGTPYGYLTGSISGLRVVIGTAITPPVGGPTSPPTAVANTRLLLNFTNAGIFDSSGNNTFRTAGSAQVDTAVKQFGTGSMEFDGSGDYLEGQFTSNLILGTGDFTVEFWVYWPSFISDGGFVGSVSNGGMDFAFTSNSLRIGRINTAWDSTFSWTPSPNTWYAIAFTRSSGVARAFVNGTSLGTSANTFSYSPTGGVLIGTSAFGDRNMRGFIDELRITKGIARYTSNYTPATKAFPLK